MQLYLYWTVTVKSHIISSHPSFLSFFLILLFLTLNVELHGQSALLLFFSSDDRQHLPFAFQAN